MMYVQVLDDTKQISTAGQIHLTRSMALCTPSELHRRDDHVVRVVVDGQQLVRQSVSSRKWRTARVHWPVPYRYEYLTIACPLLEACLIIFISGVPLLEAYAQKKWGSDPEYQAYVRRTHQLVPYVW